MLINKNRKKISLLKDLILFSERRSLSNEILKVLEI